MGTLYITAGKMVDGISDTVIQNPQLLIEEDTITVMGNLSADPRTEKAYHLDFGNNFICPGLIDAHVHIMGIHTDFSAGQLVVRGTANLREALQAGITTVRDCGGRSDVLFPLKEGVSSGLVEGPSIIISGEPVTTTGGHFHYIGIEAEGKTEVLKAVRSLCKRGVDFIKVMATGGGSTPGTNIRQSQFTQEEFEAMASDAHRLQRKITAHAHGIEGIRRVVSAGFDGIEHCSWISSTGEGIHYDPRIAEKMNKQGMVVCRTIQGSERWAIEELGEEHPGWTVYEPFRRMVSDGINLIAGTDAGMEVTDFKGLHQALETMTGLGGMTSRQAFRSATSRSAELLGLENTGSIREGNAADLIILEGNPEEDIRYLRNILGVVSKGRIRHLRKGVLKR
ncbi:MAG: amidohydrolase family protein [Spirochaetia bacterium]